MTTTDAGAMLTAWERGATQTAAMRALLLLHSALPDAAPESLAGWSVGHRDAQLLSLRERMFGPTVDCLSRCPECDGAIEVNFDLNGVRLAHADPGASFRIDIDDCELRVRPPNSTDLLALQGECDHATARRRLLYRCVLEARSPRGPLEPDELPEHAARVIEDRLAELDPQADVLLHVCCPHCGHEAHAPFEIENYLWTEVDRWARDLLVDIHLMAGAYGWSEADILSMSETRRRAYLALLRS
jgi:hypothetical protein